MRSRYTAYALGAAQYIMATTHPEGPHHQADPAVWLEELRSFCSRTRFVQLRVLTRHIDGDQGTVRFHATLMQGPQDVSFTEHSLFLRHDGQWKYHSALQTPAS